MYATGKGTARGCHAGYTAEVWVSMNVRTEKHKRYFVPEDINLDRWEDIETLFRRLLDENFYSATCVKKWLLNGY